MEFEGRISRVLPVRSGSSQRGEWKVLPFVFEYFETGDQRWPDRVLLETMDTNIMAQIGAYLKKGTDGKAVIENGFARHIAFLLYIPHMVIKVHTAIDHIAAKAGHQSILAVAEQWCYLVGRT